MRAAYRDRRVTRAVAVLIVCLGCLELQFVRGQTFSDDFNDGNDTGWTRYNVLAAVGAPATYSFPNGGYRIQTPENWTNAQLGFGRGGSLVSGSNYTDFRITHDVTDWTDLSEYVFGPLARTTTPGLGTTNGYLLILNAADKDFQLLRIEGEVPDGVELGSVDVAMLPDTDFRIVFSGLDTQLNAIVYDKTDLNNPLGHFTVDAASYGDPDNPAPYANGAVGVVVSESDDPDGVADAATFDNFRVTVPVAGEWNALGNGTVSDTRNWVGNVFPNGMDAHAKFLQGAEIDTEVVVDVFDLGKITFDNSHKYLLRGLPLTLQATGDSEISVLSGSHEISNDLTLFSNALVTVNPAAGNVSLSGVFSIGGMTLTKAGAGRLTVSNLRDGGVVANAGTIFVVPNGSDAGTSVLRSLSIGGAGRLDLNDNDLIVRATADNRDAVHADIQADIESAQNGLDPALITKWDGPGLTSSTARARNLAAGFDLTGVGVIRNADLDVTTGIPNSSYTSFSGQSVGPNDVLVKYTYIGDANLSGAVSFDDYVGIDNAFFGLIPNLGWATGDINFDGVINFDDYSKVDQAFFFQGAALGAGDPLAAVVPEATTIVLAASGLLAVGLWSRGRRIELFEKA